DNDLVDCLGLARVTSDSDSLVDMQSRAVANNLAFVERDLAIINADYSPQLIVEELLFAVFDVFREPDPIADRERNLLPLEHTELSSLVEWQLLFDPIPSDNDTCVFTPQDLPLFAAFKPLFFDSLANCPPRNLVKLHDQPLLISDGIPLLGLSHVQPL